MKKLILLISSLIGACALCCLGPILTVLGLSSLSAILIKYDYIIFGTIVIIGVITFLIIKKRKPQSCKIDCSSARK